MNPGHKQLIQIALVALLLIGCIAVLLPFTGTLLFAVVICAPTHPFRNVGLASLMEGLLDLKDIAAVESHNGVNAESDNDLAISTASHLGLPTLGGSDCHKTVAVGRCATEFSRPVHDMASFIAAVKAGACSGAYYPGYRAGT